MCERRQHWPNQGLKNYCLCCHAGSSTNYSVLIADKKPTHTVQCDVTKSTLTGIAYYTYSGTLLSKIFEAVLTTLNSCHPFELQLSIGFHSTINLIIMSFLTMPTCFL